MNIAVLSGKGGTGKTTVSTNLALALQANYIDCDVEEPNGFLFLKPSIEKTEQVMVEYPVMDDKKCVACRECIKVCQFHALAKVKDKVILFEKLCHSCGACKMACKYDAIIYNQREIGKIETGQTRNIHCSRGILNIGEPMAVPVIKKLLQNISEGNYIIDCPPGTSCNVVNTLRYVDGTILVTEPSEFGLHDLKIAVEVVKMFKLPFGIIINKDDGKDNIIRQYCKKENIQIIGAIPYSKEIAQVYSKGDILYDHFKIKPIFKKLANRSKEVLQWN